MKTLIDYIGIILITIVLSLAANRAMKLWIFQLTFPETMALEDVHWEDFSMKLRTSPKSQENEIVLVNIGNGGRREIAQEIFVLNKYNPKVIGIDVFFNCFEGKRDSINCPQLLDTLGNSMLRMAIKESKNFVMVSKLVQTQRVASLTSEIYDSLELSDETFMQYAKQGYGNVLVEGEYRQSLDNVFYNQLEKLYPK